MYTENLYLLVLLLSLNIESHGIALTQRRGRLQAQRCFCSDLESVTVLLAAICPDGKEDRRRQQQSNPKELASVLTTPLQGSIEETAYLHLGFLPTTSTFLRMRVGWCVEARHTINWIKGIPCCDVAIGLAQENRQCSSLQSECNEALFLISKTDFMSVNQSITEQIRDYWPGGRTLHFASVITYSRNTSCCNNT